MNDNINLKPTEKMGYINFWCQKVIPLVFDDSLSYYEAICKFMQKLNEKYQEIVKEIIKGFAILQKHSNTLSIIVLSFFLSSFKHFNTVAFH